MVTEFTSFMLTRIGKSPMCRLLALVATMASIGCDSKMSSKLVATKVIVPPEQGSEIERDGATVSVQPGTFSDPAEMDVEVSGRSIKISTVTATGAKVLSANVLKEVSFCAVIDPSFDRNKVYVLVEISEGQAEATTDRIPNTAIEFSEANGQVRACWQSKYVNAYFRLTMDRSRTTALKLADPNCLDPDLSVIPNSQVMTLCDGTTAVGSLDLGNLLAENIKSGVVVGGVLGSVVPAPSKCSSDGAVGCVTTTGFPAADKKTVTAADLRVGKTIAGVVGTLADCADGGSGCVAVGPLQAAATVAGSASKILSGQAVAGISGNVTLPAVGKVLTGIQFGISGTGQTGTLSLPVASNVLTGSGTYGDPDAAMTPIYSPDYPAVGNVLSTDTVNGVSGTLTLPAVGNVNSGVSYGVAGTGSTGTLTLPAAGNVLTGSGAYGNPGSAITPTLTLPSAANVKSGSGTYGNPDSAITPGYSPDFPAVTNVYSDTVDGVAGTLILPVVGDVYSGIAYGVAGNGSTGTLTLASSSNVRTGNGAFGRSGNSVTPSLTDCSTDGGTGCVAVAGFKAADMTNAVAGKIKSGVTIAGVAGDYPSVTNPLAGSDGTADLVLATFDAKIKAATNFEWFDSAGTRYVNSGDADIVDTNISSTANVFGTQGAVTAPTTPDAWDIRAGQTINGVTGKLKVSCRNSANTGLYDAGELKNAIANSTTDYFTVTSHGYADNSSIRFTALTAPTGLTAEQTTYYVRFPTANTFQLSATSGGAAINFTSDGANIVVYKWGGGVLDIWDTLEDYNNSGPVFTEADTPAAWTSDNFCGGVGTASSSAVWTDTTTDGSCDTAGDECRFKDKITGLEWSEYQSSIAWGTAMTTCANLSFGGAGAWRLPTQKELVGAYEHGIYSAANANWVTNTQMLGDNFWSSTTNSNNPSSAWTVKLYQGFSTAFDQKTYTNQVVCVR